MLECSSALDGSPASSGGSYEASRLYPLLGYVRPYDGFVRTRGQTSSRMFRVSTLSPGVPMTESVYGPALVRGLVQHGYIVGRNLIIET